MPSKPIEPEPPKPPKAFGRVLDEDAPVDDYENVVRAREEEEAQANRPPTPPNRAAARRQGEHLKNLSSKGKKGTTGSVNRSTHGHGT